MERGRITEARLSMVMRQFPIRSRLFHQPRLLPALQRLLEPPTRRTFPPVLDQLRTPLRSLTPPPQLPVSGQYKYWERIILIRTVSHSWDALVRRVLLSRL